MNSKMAKSMTSQPEPQAEPSLIESLQAHVLPIESQDLMAEAGRSGTAGTALIICTARFGNAASTPLTACAACAARRRGERHGPLSGAHAEPDGCALPSEIRSPAAAR